MKTTLLVIMLCVTLLLASSPVAADPVYFTADGTWGGEWFTDCMETFPHADPGSDDDAIICPDVTCTLDVNPDIESITLQDGATLNIGVGKRLLLNEANGTSTIGTGAVINLDGSITIDSLGTAVDHTFAGTGEIVGNASAALIEIDAAHVLRSDITIRGIMEIGRVDDTGTGSFENRGTVHADRSGTLLLTTFNINDAGPGTPQWKVTHAGATLEFDPVCAPPFCTLGLIGDFEVSRGLLLYSSQGFSTEGVLTQKQGGTIQLLDIPIEAVFSKQL